jgi:hyperosmotically inducible protein
MRHRTLFKAALLAATMLPAIAGAADGTLGDKTEHAKDRITDAARNVKTELSDSWVTAKTKIALFADERVSGTHVSVETAKGTVTLRGKVDSEAARAAAESIAKGIDGVTAVKDELQVVPPIAREAVKRTDAAISKTVATRLSTDPQLRKVDVRADAGIVILTGEVPTVGASARASELARAVPGVRAVKNDLTFGRSGDASAAMLGARG